MQDKQLTLKLFDKYEKAICKKMAISKCVYEEYKKDIIKYGGYFDEDLTYAGPGKFGDKVVPDLWFRFSAYCHDALYTACRNKSLGVTKENADLFFYYSMLCQAKWYPHRRFMAYIYYKSVQQFGVI